MDGNLNALTTIFTEFYYWVTVVFMFLIHVGFCMYEVGASRRKKSHAHANEKCDDHTTCDSHILFLWMVDILGFPNVPIIWRFRYWRWKCKHAMV